MDKSVAVTLATWTLTVSIIVTQGIAQETKPTTGDDVTLQAAKAQAEKYVGKRFRKCGSDHFSKKFLKGEGGISSITYVYQYKDLHWNIEPDHLTKADKLNGLQWRAKILVSASFKRFHSDGGLLDHSTRWTSWQDVTSSISFQQTETNSAWKIEPDTSGDFGEDPITCKEVADLLKEGNSR